MRVKENEDKLTTAVNDLGLYVIGAGGLIFVGLIVAAVIMSL